MIAAGVQPRLPDKAGLVETLSWVSIVGGIVLVAVAAGVYLMMRRFRQQGQQGFAENLHKLEDGVRQSLADADAMRGTTTPPPHTDPDAPLLASFYLTLWSGELLLPKRLRSLTGIADALAERGVSPIETKLMLMGDWYQPPPGETDPRGIVERHLHDTLAAFAAELNVDTAAVEAVYRKARFRRLEEHYGHID